MTNISILYITYDGLLEPLGQSQVLGYLEKLAGEHNISIISFEKKEDREDKTRMVAMRERLATNGIRWVPLAYHKTPSAPATAFDITVGSLVALWMVLTRRIDIVHARSYVPALMSLVAKRLTGVKFLFDMRGFWADERIDGGLWSAGGCIYRTTKALERRFLLAADHVVTLTHASKKVLAGFDYLQGRMPPVTVIPTCADLGRFKRQEVESKHPFTFGYVGSVGTWYLFEETLVFFKALLEHRSDAQLLVVNRNEHAMIREAVAQAGIAENKLELVAAEYCQVPVLISRMHAAGAIIRPCFSKIASAPTKLAEYLGCGVPCVGNTGVGDIQEILEGKQVGVVLNNFSDSEMQTAGSRLIDLTRQADIRQRCRQVALQYFSLEDGVTAYDRIYQEMQD